MVNNYCYQITIANVNSLANKLKPTPELVIILYLYCMLIFYSKYTIYILAGQPTITLIYLWIIATVSLGLSQ